MRFTLKKFFALIALGMGGFSTAQAQPDWLNAGPLFDEFPLTLETGHRIEALGPFWRDEEKDTQRQWAVPPLGSFTRDTGTDFSEFDLAYPVLTYDRFGSEYRWQLFQLLSYSGGMSHDDNMARRFTIFPFYFQQRSPEEEKNYTALFPIYGTIKARLFRDEIYFVLFPVYSQTRKKDVVTDNWLYPIFHLRTGDELRGWQVWPLIGREHKDAATRTNHWGDEVIVPGHEKTFLFWPFYFNAHSGLGTTNPLHQNALLPLYSIYRSPARDSTTLLWPFFNFTEDRAKSYREWSAPWPFVVVARGEGKHGNRVWPLFSRMKSPTHESAYYLWPVYKFNRLHSDPLDRKRTRILFFLYSSISEKNTETGESLERRDFWPFYTYRKGFDGDARLQVLALLEPVLPNNKSIERNYSPVWSLWRAEQSPKTGKSSQSFLWNLYRLDTSPESKKISLLFGLFQYQSGTQGKLWRVCYIPFGTADAKADSVQHSR